MFESLKYTKKTYIDDDRPVPKFIISTVSCIVLTVLLALLLLFGMVFDNEHAVGIVLSCVSGTYIFLILYTIKYKGLFNSSIVKKKGFLTVDIIMQLIKDNGKEDEIYDMCLPIFDKMGITINEAYLNTSGPSHSETYSKLSDMFSKYLPRKIRYDAGKLIYDYCIEQGLSEIDASDLAYMHQTRNVCGNYIFAMMLLHWSSKTKDRLDYLYTRSEELTNEFDAIVDKMKIDIISIFDNKLRQRMKDINNELEANLNETREIRRSLGIQELEDEEVGVK